MRHARCAVFVVIAAALAGCAQSQPARTRITPGKTEVKRTEAAPTKYRIILRQPRPVYVPIEAEVQR